MTTKTEDNGNKYDNDKVIKKTKRNQIQSNQINWFEHEIEYRMLDSGQYMRFRTIECTKQAAIANKKSNVYTCTNECENRQRAREWATKNYKTNNIVCATIQKMSPFILFVIFYCCCMHWMLYSVYVCFASFRFVSHHMLKVRYTFESFWGDENEMSMWTKKYEHQRKKTKVTAYCEDERKKNNANSNDKKIYTHDKIEKK